MDRGIHLNLQWKNADFIQLQEDRRSPPESLHQFGEKKLQLKDKREFRT